MENVMRILDGKLNVDNFLGHEEHVLFVVELARKDYLLLSWCVMKLSGQLVLILLL